MAETSSPASSFTKPDADMVDEPRGRRGGRSDDERNERERSRSPRPARGDAASRADILLTVSLFREGDKSVKQLSGTVFLKTAPTHKVLRVAKAFCRWVKLPFEDCTVYDAKKNALDPDATVAASGLDNSSPIIVFVAADSPQVDPMAASAPFTIVDVVDSELADLSGDIGV